MISLASILRAHEARALAAREVRAAKQQASAARLMAIPHWLDRCASGAMPTQGLTEEVLSAIRARAREIAALRVRRGASRRTPDIMRSAVQRILWRGVIPITKRAVMAQQRARISYYPGHTEMGMPSHATARAAAKAWLRADCVRASITRGMRSYELHRDYILLRAPGRSPQYFACGGGRIGSIMFCRHVAEHREKTARSLRAQRAARPDPLAPTSLGWRAWKFDGRHLVSPHQETVWDAPELAAEQWSDADAVRGVAGIHARRMPRNWLRAGWPAMGDREGPEAQSTLVTGIVERFDRFVLGETGWRAEHVVIRELCAPSVAIMLTLMQHYPEVRVHLSPAAKEAA